MAATEDELIQRAALRMSAVTSGVVFGLLSGGGLFLATVWLVMKGGPHPGPHLGLLSQFFPGYDVTLAGAVVGLFYAFVAGYCAGFVLARIYNALAR